MDDSPGTPRRLHPKLGSPFSPVSFKCDVFISTCGSFSFLVGSEPGQEKEMLFVGVPFNSPDGFVFELLMLNLPSECESSRAGRVLALSSA